MRELYSDVSEWTWTISFEIDSVTFKDIELEIVQHTSISLLLLLPFLPYIYMAQIPNSDSFLNESFEWIACCLSAPTGVSD